MAKRKQPKRKVRKPASRRGVNAVTGYSPKSKRYHGPRGGFMSPRAALNARAVAREIVELRFTDARTLSQDDRKLRNQQFTIQSQARTESYESVFRRNGWLTERHLAEQEALDEAQLAMGQLPAPHYTRPGVLQPDGRRLVERVWIWGGKGNLKAALPGGIMQRGLVLLRDEVPEPAVQWVVYDAGHNKPPVGVSQPESPQMALTHMASWRQKPSAKPLPDLAAAGAKILTQLVAMNSERAKPNGTSSRRGNKAVRKVQGKRPRKVPKGKAKLQRKRPQSRVPSVRRRGKGGGGGAGLKSQKLMKRKPKK